MTQSPKNLQNSNKYTFCFITQSGKYESMSILLARSIRYQYGDTVDLIVGVPFPETKFGVLLDSTIKYFKRINAKLVNINNNLNYKIGNKVLLMQEAIRLVKTEYLIFLDSDMFAIENRINLKLRKNELGVLMVRSNNHYAQNYKFWSKISQDSNIPISKISILGKDNREIEMYPFYNAGFIAIHRSNKQFPALWLQLLRWYLPRTKSYEPMNVQRAYSDQITLVLAINKYNIPIHNIPNGYNYNSSFLENLVTHPPLYFVHYHRHDYHRVERIEKMFWDMERFENSEQESLKPTL